mgnify:CR=1 FL=1
MASIQDTFNRDNSVGLGLSSDSQFTWVAVINDWDVVLNQAKGQNAAAINMVRTGFTLTNDQSAQFDVITATTSGVLIACRFDVNGGNHYGYFVENTTSGGGHDIILSKRVNGTLTVLGTTSPTLAAPETTKVEAIGTAIKSYYNGVQQSSAVDSDITGRSVREQAMRAGFGAAIVDNFSATDVASGPTETAVTPRRGTGTLTGPAIYGLLLACIQFFRL